MGDDDKEETKAADVEVQQGGDDEQEAQGGVTVAGLHISDAQLPNVGMFFSGLILLIAVLVGGRGLEFWEYAISLASVAMFFSLLAICLTFCKKDLTAVHKPLSIFLFLWCFVGACILTFKAPFTITGNGYFAAWGLAVCSVMGVGLTAAAIKKGASSVGPLLGLAASSIIVIVAVIPEMTGNSDYRGIEIYGLVVACVSVVVAAVYAGTDKCKALKVVTLWLFAILWIVAACLLTFRGPFLITGNGYFGSWGGAVFSVMAAMTAMKE